MLLLAAPIARAQSSESDDDSLMLFAISVDREVIADAVTGYPLEGSVLLPLKEICDLLRFGIIVDAERHRAEGFFINESRRFVLDVDAGTVEVEQQKLTFPAGKVMIREGENEIYVDAALLAKWFPIDTQVNLFGAVVTMHAREKLPFQLRREREQQIERALAPMRQSGPSLPIVTSPYALLSEPFVDQQMRIIATKGGNSAQYTTYATGDFLGLEASAFLNGSSTQPLRETRVSLGRHDPDGRLLGPLHATEVAAGDVFLGGSELTTTPARGTGAIVSNFPLQPSFQFDEQTLEGELRPGWEVELYLNGALIGWQAESHGGRYQFKNVPVLYGVNTVRLVFYGPLGERRETLRTYNIGETLTPRGKVNYRIGSAAPEALSSRALAEVAYGLTDRLTITGSASTLAHAGVILRREDGEGSSPSPAGRSFAAAQDDTVSHRYASAGVRGAWERFFFYGDAARDVSLGGSIARAGVQTRLGRVSLTLSRAQLRDGFVSETFPATFGAIQSRTTLRAGGVIALHKFLMPATFDVQRDELPGGGSFTRLGSLLSTSLGRTWISNRIEGTLTKNVQLPNAPVGQNVTGALNVSRRVRGVSVRGEMTYDLRPRRRLSVATLIAELPLIRHTQLAGELSRSVAVRETRFTTRIRHDRGPVAATLAIELPTRGAPVVRFELSTSIIPNPLTRRVQLRARPAAATGSVAARVFFDQNANGRRDAGEPPIDSAGFFVNRNSVPVVTDCDGIAMLDDLPSYSPTDVRLSPSTLEDPWLAPSRPGVRMIPRPGKALVVDFPVSVSGEVTGTVRIEKRFAAGVRLQLVDAFGAVVKETRSETEGIYDLANVPMGVYMLRIHPEDVAREKLVDDAAREVTITAQTTSVTIDVNGMRR